MLSADDVELVDSTESWRVKAGRKLVVKEPEDVEDGVGEEEPEWESLEGTLSENVTRLLALMFSGSRTCLSAVRARTPRPFRPSRHPSLRPSI